MSQRVTHSAILLVAVWKAKEGGRIRRVKHWQIAFIVALSTSLAPAEDFKTVTGKEYKDATVTRV